MFYFILLQLVTFLVFEFDLYENKSNFHGLWVELYKDMNVFQK